MKSSAKKLLVSVLCGISLPAFLWAVEFEKDKSLNFADRADFELVKRGLMRKPSQEKIIDKNGKLVWDFKAYDFLSKIDPGNPVTVHPSLLRQAILNNHAGLFEITKGIYQVRGFDIANTMFVRSKNGWIVLDTLTVPETAAAAKALLDEEFGPLPVVAVIYSHSHADHFGGVQGFITPEDAASGKVKVIAPKYFLEKAISENVIIGNAMDRRTIYAYGFGLPKSAEGHVDSALGKAIAAGAPSLIAPTHTIDKSFETMEIDGVKFIFQLTPGTEAPAEMNAYLPDFKALWIAENSACTLHNIYTLRGAEVRDAKMWSKYLNETIHRFGGEAEVMFGSHNWPRWGNQELNAVLRNQRDMYGYIHNYSLYLANRGVTINEIHNVFKAPDSLNKEWYNRGYYGSLSHNSRAVINKYLGFFDMVPANLNKLSPSASGKLYVDYMGGADAILQKAQKDFDSGNYRWVAEVLNHLVFAEPDNVKAKQLLADCYEKLGFLSENTTWRDTYLSGAAELRRGILPGLPGTDNPAVLAAMEPEMMLDFLAVNVNPAKAEGKSLLINFETPKQTYIAELSNCTLNVLSGFRSDKADLTVKAASPTALVMMLAAPQELDKMLSDQSITLTGDKKILEQLFSMLDKPKKNFPIVTP